MSRTYTHTPFRFNNQDTFRQLAGLRRCKLPAEVLSMALGPLITLCFTYTGYRSGRGCSGGCGRSSAVSISSSRSFSGRCSISKTICCEQTCKRGRGSSSVSLLTQVTRVSFDKSVMLRRLIRGLKLHDRVGRTRSFRRLTGIVRGTCFIVSAFGGRHLVQRDKTFLLSNDVGVRLGGSSCNTDQVRGDDYSLGDRFTDREVVVPTKDGRDLLRRLGFCGVGRKTLFPRLRRRVTCVGCDVYGSGIEDTSSFRGVSFSTVGTRRSGRDIRVTRSMIERRLISGTVCSVVSRCVSSSTVGRGILQVVAQRARCVS